MSAPQTAPVQVSDATVLTLPQDRWAFSLVMACLRGWLDASASGRVADLIGGCPDWSLLLQKAETHGVLPVVYTQLARNRQLIRPEAWAQLSSAHEENTRRSLFLTSELTRILRLFESAGVEAIPFKGPALAAMAYEDIALRQSSDLDILIRPSDARLAGETLLHAGYVSEYTVTGHQERALIATGYERPFVHKKMRCIVELQWALLPRFYAVHCQMDDLFARSGVTDVQDYRFRALDPHDLLLAVSVHAAKHLWKRLCWLLDVIQIARSQPLDWDLVRARAREWGVERMVLTGFALAVRLLDAEMPDPVVAWLSCDAAASAFAEELGQQIVQGRHLDPESQAYFRLMSKLRERASDRAKFFWRLAVTPSFGEWSLVRLPDRLFPLYRAVRVARLAHRALTRG
jgi:putative nucleotidyltransferase-like protein